MTNFIENINTFDINTFDINTFNINELNTTHFFENEFMIIRYMMLNDIEYDVDNSSNILDNIIKNRVNILFINVNPITPKRGKWEECKQNIERFWDTVPGIFYIVFDFSNLSILPPTYIRDWVSLFQYNNNITVDKIPGSMMIIKTGILRKAVKYYLSQWKPEVPIFVFKKFGSAYRNIIGIYTKNIEQISMKNLIRTVDDL